MNELTLDTLRQRLDRLERETWRLKRVGAAVLVGIATVVLMGQATTSRTVEAERFILKDASGKSRGALGIGANGTVALFLLDQDGKHRVELSLGNEGSPSFILRDKAEKVLWKAP